MKNKRRRRIKIFLILLIGIGLTFGSFCQIFVSKDTKTDVTRNGSSDANVVWGNISDIFGGSSSESNSAATDWYLLLVNPWNAVPDDFSVKLKKLKNGHAIDERAYPDLQAMMDAARAEGLSPLICSSYRTNEKQTTLYNNEVKKYLSQGYSQTDAEAQARKWVAYPGTSEHQTGLAVDIVSASYQLLDKKQESTPEQKWLMENSYKYGFILRYPNEKSEITGIYYEPWHYRYVGKEVAKEIHDKGICLEEYLKKER